MPREASRRESASGWRMRLAGWLAATGPMGRMLAVAERRRLQRVWRSRRWGPLGMLLVPTAMKRGHRECLCTGSFSKE